MSIVSRYVTSENYVLCLVPSATIVRWGFVKAARISSAKVIVSARSFDWSLQWASISKVTRDLSFGYFPSISVTKRGLTFNDCAIDRWVLSSFSTRSFSSASSRGFKREMFFQNTHVFKRADTDSCIKCPLDFAVLSHLFGNSPPN